MRKEELAVKLDVEGLLIFSSITCYFNHLALDLLEVLEWALKFESELLDSLLSFCLCFLTNQKGFWLLLVRLVYRPCILVLSLSFLLVVIHRDAQGVARVYLSIMAGLVIDVCVINLLRNLQQETGLI
jgi:hypothetical protein